MPKEFSRTLRINTQIQRELGELIRDELTDPRIGSITVTHVSVSPDLRNARVAVSSLEDDAALARSVKALNGAGGMLRRGLAKRLKLRTVPAVRFVADTVMREGDRLTTLIRQATASDLHATGATAAGESAEDRADGSIDGHPGDGEEPPAA